ncbi:acetamidase [Massariosphaeria phaeospora]|uniref:amidase n=1 Tax=Massariosphaeria phaeospora TaxID=100035 RepID=A0A7C8M6D2_9PLEO|nr:acetamidase [Massariosphaeria phaeospora]
MSPEPAEWKAIAQQKKDEQWSRIPPEWRLKNLPPKDVTNYLDIPRTCGLLSAEELQITENYDATALAEGIKKRRLKSVDVVRAFCKRAAIAHQLTTCLTEIFFTDALARAAELDAHLASGKPPLGPLHGVPVSLKDSFKIKGYDASIGMTALAFRPAQQNSTLVDVLLGAGAVLYVKTNVPQTLAALDSHNWVFGRTLNPHNTLSTAGGSSGGEGALLALRGSILGIGTDVGGSIRIPAMCNGLYGLKPSCERIPYSGQESGTLPGQDRLGLKASAGPLAHSMRDIELFFRAVAGQRPWELDADVVPGPWETLAAAPPRTKLRIGVVRRDDVADPLPPIARLLGEVATALHQAADIEVVDLDIAPLLSQCATLANALFSPDGNTHILSLLASTSEPLSPWLSSRLGQKPELSLAALRDLHARREALQMQFLDVWKGAAGLAGGQGIDALICPVAAHPVPLIDCWNGVSYTSAFVVLDCAAGTLPVRVFGEAEMRGEGEACEPLGSWDKANRKLWTHTPRSAYLNTPLCIQVVAPKLQERRLCDVMQRIDDAVKAAGLGGQAGAGVAAAKL